MSRQYQQGCTQLSRPRRKGDAVDILYEARNITGWTPAHGDDWWEDLPDFGEHTWQQRASAARQQVLRIAFVPSKFRLGMDPEPFCLEIDTRQEPWTLTDCTEDLATAGARAAQEHTRKERRNWNMRHSPWSTMYRRRSLRFPSNARPKAISAARERHGRQKHYWKIALTVTAIPTPGCGICGASLAAMVAPLASISPTLSSLVTLVKRIVYKRVV